jgi:hypothetical protein
MEKQNFEFGRIILKYGIVNTFPYFGDLGHRSAKAALESLFSKSSYSDRGRDLD